MVSVVAKPLPPIFMSERGFVVTDIEGAMRLGRVYLRAKAVPESTLRDCATPDDALARVVCIIEAGRSLGIGPRESLTNIAFIRGKLALWGDLTVALCQRHPAWRGISCEWNGDGDKRKCVCTVKRDGCPDVVQSFSVADAKKAGLTGDVWNKYTDRMLQQRARAFALRDQFADALLGMSMAEELDDSPNVDSTANVRAALI